MCYVHYCINAVNKISTKDKNTSEPKYRAPRIHNESNIKGKVAPVLFFNSAPCHNSVLGSGGIAPRVLDLGT